jgi:hypothetical protein
MIDRIEARTGGTAIIVIQGDHGSGLGMNAEDVTKMDCRERMSIFNAYHLPGKGREMLYPSITPVNTFRVIFDSYLGGHFALWPDRSYPSAYMKAFHFMLYDEKTYAGPQK